MILYIDGSIQCFQYWQIANFLFLICWVFSFPLAVGFGYRMMKAREITPLMFLVYLTFPIALFLRILFKRLVKREQRHIHQKANNRLVEIFEEPYKEKYVWWEAWRLMERFIVAGLSVFRSYLSNFMYHSCVRFLLVYS